MRSPRPHRTKPAYDGSEKGSALLTALIVLSLVTLMGVSLTYNAMVENSISRNHETRTQAFFIAEAGLAHAVEIVLKTKNNNGILAGADGDKSTRADNGVLNLSLIPRGHAPIPAGGVTFLNGRYEVRVYDDDYNAVLGLLGGFEWTSLIPTGLPVSDLRYGLREDGDLYFDINERVVIRSTGFAPNGAAATVEAIIGPRDAVAILTQEELSISGNPIIDGSGGSLHTNSNLRISGNPSVSQNATATGTLTVSGNPNVGGLQAGGQPIIEIPNIQAADYKSQADYILKANGTVYSGAGAYLFDTTPGIEYRGWKRSSASPVVWSFSSDAIFPGTYYVEGMAVISGNPGSKGDPSKGIPPIYVDMTLWAEGSIEISGNPVIQAKIPGVLFVADGDIKINGNPNQDYKGGLIYAGEQIGISGNPSINGYIMAKGRQNRSTTVDDNYISGNLQITWDNRRGLLTGVISWREVRN